MQQLTRAIRSRREMMTVLSGETGSRGEEQRSRGPVRMDDEAKEKETLSWSEAGRGGVGRGKKGRGGGLS